MKRKKQKRKAACVRHTWTEEELDEIEKLFKKYLQTGTCPRQTAIESKMAKSKKNGGYIWKLKRDNIKKKISYLNSKKR